MQTHQFQSQSSTFLKKILEGMLPDPQGQHAFSSQYIILLCRKVLLPPLPPGKDETQYRYASMDQFLGRRVDA